MYFETSIINESEHVVERIFYSIFRIQLVGKLHDCMLVPALEKDVLSNGLVLYAIMSHFPGTLFWI